MPNPKSESAPAVQSKHCRLQDRPSTGHKAVVGPHNVHMIDACKKIASGNDTSTTSYQRLIRYLHMRSAQVPYECSVLRTHQGNPVANLQCTFRTVHTALMDR